jgi:hypothetical protein
VTNTKLDLGTQNFPRVFDYIGARLDRVDLADNVPFGSERALEEWQLKVMVAFTVARTAVVIMDGRSGSEV